jgi:membrane protein YdbS with pleckstrin-like domain
MTPEEIYALERPQPALLTLYIWRALLTGPLVIVTLPFYVFRYISLRYTFDAQGIHMRWGIIFRREINLTYARIQDIHVRSGVVQRWLGLADLMVQTASGSMGPEMTIEGFREHHAIRDFLYARMRGLRGGGVAGQPAASAGGGAALPSSPEVLTLLHDIRDELRGAREALEKRRLP